MQPVQDPSTVSVSGGMDFTIWLVMFGILIAVALVLAYLSKDMPK